MTIMATGFQRHTKTISMCQEVEDHQAASTKSCPRVHDVMLVIEGYGISPIYCGRGPGFLTTSYQCKLKLHMAGLPTELAFELSSHQGPVRSVRLNSEFKCSIRACGGSRLFLIKVHQHIYILCRKWQLLSHLW